MDCHTSGNSARRSVAEKIPAELTTRRIFIHTPISALSSERSYNRYVRKMELKDFEKIHKALANRRRLAAVQYLRGRKEGNLGDIAEHLKLSYKATSKHLALLAAADIVEKEQRSVQMFFRISKNLPDLAKHTLAAL